MLNACWACLPDPGEMHMAKGITDKVALITGASRGIGRAIALCLAEEGADVVINYRQHGEEAEEVANQVRALGRRALVVRADAGERDDVRRLVDAAVEGMGRVDFLVANAYYSRQLPVVDLPWDEVRRTVDVTMFGVWHLCQFGAQQLIRQGRGGKILLIGSMQALYPAKTCAPYNMSKAGISHLARTLAAELLPQHIHVNVIHPGWIDTPGERLYATDEEIEAQARRLPWGRLGQPEEIGRAAVFMLSADADYITGTELLVDGGEMVGMTLPWFNP
jgi:glucose 1-dehydrogenase